jgi:hypothetical protein
LRIRAPSDSRSVMSPTDGDPGVSRPTRVIVARFRIIAVIGIVSSSASHTAELVRCSDGSASRGSWYSRTSRAASSADPARCARV